MAAPSLQSPSTRRTWPPMLAALMQAQVGHQPLTTLLLSLSVHGLLVVLLPTFALLHACCLQSPVRPSRPYTLLATCSATGVETTTFHFQLNYTGLEGALARMGGSHWGRARAPLLDV
jgi:hypothetical protein